MKQQKKMTGRASSMPVGLAWGAAVSGMITLALTALMAKMIAREVLAWENVGYGVMFMLLAASFLGAVTAGGKIKRQRLLVCLTSGGIYMMLLLCVTALFFGGQYEAVGVTALLIGAGSVCAALIKPGEKNRGVRKKHRIRG